MARCGSCHIGGMFDSSIYPNNLTHPTDPGSPWPGDPGRTFVECTLCHGSVGSPPETTGPYLNEPYSVADTPTVAKCMVCHLKERAKRGFQETNDVHIVRENMLCQTCHYRDPVWDDDPTPDHQFLKGYVIDTSNPAAKGTMQAEGADCEGCHLVVTGDPIHKNAMLNQHAAKIACETCHTGIRPAGVAINDRSWQYVNYTLPVTHMRMVDWLPWLKWYDGGGSPTGYPSYNSLPILNDADLLKDSTRPEKVFDAKIYPYNNIEVTWWLKSSISDYDDTIPNSKVKAADIAGDGNGTTTETEMRAYNSGEYPYATPVTDTVCFAVSHSVQPKEDAFRCNDCHGDGVMGRYADGWAKASGAEKNTWEDLGYPGGDPLPGSLGTTIEDIEMSYHGHLGHLSTADVTDHEQGMLEKWCALPNLSIADDGIEGPGSWTARCGGGAGGACHIGGTFADTDLTLGTQTWERNPLRLTADCARCHNMDGDQLTAPTNDKCMTCHGKEIAKRGYDTGKDIHMVDHSMLCQDCHYRFTADGSDHQFAKGTVLDTSMAQAKDTMDGGCSAAACHGAVPVEHSNAGSLTGMLNDHLDKVACETCHTGLRTGGLALKSRSWQSGSVANAKRMTDWVPFHKWYDGSGSPSYYPASGHLPILGADEMKGNPGAKIYPFNDITVTWWLKNTGSPAEPPYDDVIPNSVAAAATAYYGHTPSQSEMRGYDGPDAGTDPDYPDALLVTDTVSFNVSHSVEASFTCSDCHGWASYVMEWTELGFAGDPAPDMSASISSLSTRRCNPKARIDLNGSLFGDSLEDFGDPRENTKVKFKVAGVGGINLKVLEWSDTTITVKIPKKSKLESKFGALPVTGKVYIQNGKNKSNKKKLTIK
jgi:hypothetical protein